MILISKQQITDLVFEEEEDLLMCERSGFTTLSCECGKCRSQLIDFYFSDEERDEFTDYATA